MKKICSILVVLIVSACSHSAGNHDVKNLKQGIVLGMDKNSTKIDIEGNSFSFKPNGSCTINNTLTKNCMWWGVSFTHSKSKSDYKIPCTVTTSQSVDQVDPSKEYKKHIKSFKTSLPIKASTTYSEFPFYVGYDPEGSGVLKIKSECTDINGNIFSFGISIDFG